MSLSLFKSKLNLLPVVQPAGVALVVGKGKVEISPSGDLRSPFKSKQGQFMIDPPRQAELEVEARVRSPPE